MRRIREMGSCQSQVADLARAAHRAAERTLVIACSAYLRAARRRACPPRAHRSRPGLIGPKGWAGAPPAAPRRYAAEVAAGSAASDAYGPYVTINSATDTSDTAYGAYMTVASAAAAGGLCHLCAGTDGRRGRRLRTPARDPRGVAP
jgi:hypothetical protein